MDTDDAVLQSLLVEKDAYLIDTFSHNLKDTVKNYGELPLLDKEATVPIVEAYLQQNEEQKLQPDEFFYPAVVEAIAYVLFEANREVKEGKKANLIGLAKKLFGYLNAEDESKQEILFTANYVKWVASRVDSLMTDANTNWRIRYDPNLVYPVAISDYDIICDHLEFKNRVKLEKTQFESEYAHIQQVNREAKKRPSFLGR